LLRANLGEHEGRYPLVLLQTLRGHFGITEMAPDLGEHEGIDPLIL
jgi:hypothetical protein